MAANEMKGAVPEGKRGGETGRKYSGIAFAMQSS